MTTRQTDPAAEGEAAGRRQSEALVGTPVECMECGRRVKTRSYIPECPKCGGSDIEVREREARRAKRIALRKATEQKAAADMMPSYRYRKPKGVRS